ncbi:hypothetical protein BSL78_00198 [Apostichopus japonicus]|uniref:Ig-like domain-containing protein n=1 Tax=Stichopus japonicus TaxID=307972 RepID=A0A2G8LRL3_STIJA|nr:hypothetical protein BSL78_00198 [Apostichopus japonicus]
MVLAEWHAAQDAACTGSPVATPAVGDTSRAPSQPAQETLNSAEFTESTSHNPFGLSECSLVQYLEIGRMGLVHCSFKENYLAVAWYNVNEMKPILLYKDGVKTGDGFDSGEFDIYPNGSLVIRNVTMNYESVYTVSKILSRLELPVSYDINVHTTVDPMPAFPLVDGCNYQQYCVLEKEPRDVLTCSVLGIRPDVTLEWRAFRQETLIVFTQHAFKVTQKGDVYDVSLTVNFDITVAAQDKITVECHAVGENSELFSLSTKVDLLFNNGKYGWLN